MMTGYVTTVTIAVKVLTVTVMRSIIADIAVHARRTMSCVMTAVIVLMNAVSVTKNVADAIQQAVMCVTYVTKNVQNALISSATTAASVLIVQVMSCIVPIVCCVSAVQNGYATAVRGAQIVPADVVNAMRNAWSAQKTSYVQTAELALAVWAGKGIIAQTVCFASSVRNISVNVAEDVPNVYLFVNSVAKNARIVSTAVFAKTAEFALTVWVETETSV